VTCDRCGKPTFAGCGLHIEQVLGDVPRGERCQCADLIKPVRNLRTWLRGLVGRK